MKKANFFKQQHNMGLTVGLTYGFHCVALTRSDMSSLEEFQKRAIRWITDKICQLPQSTKNAEFVTTFYVSSIK